MLRSPPLTRDVTFSVTLLRRKNIWGGNDRWTPFPVMITLSAVLFLLFNRVLFIVDLAGVVIYSRIIVMASLSVSIEKYLSTIPKLMLLRRRITTPPPYLLGRSLRLMIWIGISSLNLLLGQVSLKVRMPKSFPLRKRDVSISIFAQLRMLI